MGRFFERYLPVSERRTALWLALGGAVVSVVAAQVGSLARGAAAAASVAAGTGGEWTPALVSAAVQFALVAVLVGVLIRFARAPEVLALYLVLGAAVAVALSAIGLPIDYLVAKAASALDPAHFAEHPTEWLAAPAKGALEDVAIGLGALAGAWIAATVSLARIRDTGFSGDDDGGRGLHAKPEPMGWRFVGWQGRPLSGDPLIAVSLVAIRVIPGLVGLAATVAGLLAPGRATDAGSSAIWASSMGALVLAWVVSAWLVTMRTGVVSAWTVMLGGLLQALWFAAVNIALGGVTPNAVPLMLLQGVAVPVVLLAGAIGGTEVALRRRTPHQAATLSDTSHPQDPDAAAAAPADTAGGEDG